MSSNEQTISGENSIPHNASIDEDAQVKKISIEELDTQHRKLFIRAVRRILATDIAKHSYAEIIDGLPLADSINDNAAAGLSPEHPIYEMHRELCNGVMERAEKMSANFDPSVLKFDSLLLFAYQAASPGSRAFRMRLIEMIAVAIHQIAVIIFQLDESLHKDDGIVSWAPPKEDGIFWQFYPDGPPPTLFTHDWYKDFDQYPNGVADMVGYWAESRILGGVVLFDRGTPKRKPDPEAVYFHPDRDEVTYRICQLNDSQKQQMLDFLLSDDPAPNPFPIMLGNENPRRVDPEEDIDVTGVYRDIWERKPLPPDAPDGRGRDVFDGFDYLTIEEFHAAGRRYRDRQNRIYSQ